MKLTVCITVKQMSAVEHPATHRWCYDATTEKTRLTKKTITHNASPDFLKAGIITLLDYATIKWTKGDNGLSCYVSEHITQ